MPKIFGILLLIAGLGYLADGFGTVLIPEYSISIEQFTFVGEVALIFWLLISGSRNDFRRPDANHTISSIRTPRSPPRWDNSRHQSAPPTPGKQS